MVKWIVIAVATVALGSIELVWANPGVKANEWLGLLFTAVSAVATSVYAVFAYGQWTTLVRQAKNMEESLAASKKVADASAAAAQASERSAQIAAENLELVTAISLVLRFVDVQEDWGDGEGDPPSHCFVCSLDNTGFNVALVDRVSGKWNLGADDVMDFGLTLGKYLQPGESFPVRLMFGTLTPEQEWTYTSGQSDALFTVEGRNPLGKKVEREFQLRVEPPARGEW